MNGLTYVRKNGIEIESVLDDLATLRIAVFRDFPYLYEGSLDYERAYLRTYVNSDRAFLFSVFDGNKMVGATTCIPLEDETPDIKQPFEVAGFDLKTVFYFGESILLPQYRGIGSGHRFFDEREAHAKSFGIFKTTCFCSVVRPKSHPLKPKEYRSNDVFWLKRGYQKSPDLACEMEWLDIAQNAPTTKKLEFWLKNS